MVIVVRAIVIALLAEADACTWPRWARLVWLRRDQAFT